MVKLRRDGTKVVAEISCGLETAGSLLFTWDTEREIFAQALYEKMRDAMWSNLKRIRRDAYEQGWKDAKAHRAKESYFDEGW